jgi:hypothetical protein
MAERHISEELLGRFLRLEASREESKEVVRHLLSGCPQCSGLAFRMSSEVGLYHSQEHAYGEVFARALAFANEEEQRLALEKLRGWAQWAELEPMIPQARFVKVESERRFHTYGLYERLLEAAVWYRPSEPTEAVDIIRLAILVAERLDPKKIGKQRIADLKASAWAALANEKRIAEDFAGAQRAFKTAWRLLESGTGDPLEGCISSASKPRT